MSVRRRIVTLLVLVPGVVAMTACSGTSHTAGPSTTRADVRVYLAQVEPVRLGVNELLERADPILDAYRSGETTASVAQRQFDELTRTFDDYRSRITAVRPRTPELSSLQAPYARTYGLEEAYLAALAAALPQRDYHHLPHTAADQRRAIVVWRKGLTVLARRLGAPLPTDLKIAGVGEIAPSPSGS
jgi:hypothetical protein